MMTSSATEENFEFAALNAADNYRRALRDEFAPHLGQRVLEIGAGVGQFTRELLSVSGVDYVHAVEPNARFFQDLSALAGLNRATCGTVTDLRDEEPFDSVVSVNVLEHIEDDGAELRHYREKLRAGGKLCLFTPACPCLYAPIDRLFGHYRRYRRADLRALLLARGFNKVNICYYNSLGFLAWWLNFCVLKKNMFEIGKVRFFDRWLFPSVHAIESNLLRPPIGQNLLVIASV